MGRNRDLAVLSLSNIDPGLRDLLRYASVAWDQPQARIVEAALREYFSQHPVPSAIPAPKTPATVPTHVPGATDPSL